MTNYWSWIGGPVYVLAMSRRGAILSVYVLLLREEEVFLLRRANTGWMDGAWTVVAGHVEPNESVSEAAIREAGEEAGVVIAPQDLRVLGAMHRRGEEGQDRVDWFYTSTRWRHEARNAEPDKCSEVKWARLDESSRDLAVLDYVRASFCQPQGEPWLCEFGWSLDAEEASARERGRQETELIRAT
jgi:8-oxo-dGTP pyrophosphatase MutT (NUDIX family)